MLVTIPATKVEGFATQIHVPQGACKNKHFAPSPDSHYLDYYINKYKQLQIHLPVAQNVSQLQHCTTELKIGAVIDKVHLQQLALPDRQ